MKRKENKRSSQLKVLQTADPQSVVGDFSPEDILLLYGRPRYLLSSSSKTKKSESVGVLNRILYLTSGVLCPAATAVCRELCLGHTSGRMTQFQSAKARDRRTALYLHDPSRFLDILFDDLSDMVSDANEYGLTPAVRLNGTSDVPWERLHGEVFREFPEIEFYDYTKIMPRYRQYLDGSYDGKPWPDNYALTFSMGERVASDFAVSLLRDGGNVAVVFFPGLPPMWNGFPVIDGDTHDARFLDEPSTVIGLVAKGRIAKRDGAGFVVRTDEYQQQLNAA